MEVAVSWVSSEERPVLALALRTREIDQVRVGTHPLQDFTYLVFHHGTPQRRFSSETMKRP